MDHYRIDVIRSWHCEIVRHKANAQADIDQTFQEEYSEASKDGERFPSSCVVKLNRKQSFSDQ